MKARSLRVGVVLLLAGAVISCAAEKTAVRPDSPAAPTASASSEETSASLRAPAPDFRLSDDKGRTVSLSEFKGKVVWLTFWASWCAPCKAELTALDKIREDLAGRDFEVLAVNIDPPDHRSVAQAQARALNVRFPILFDPDSRVVSRYNPSLSLPFAVLIDRQGRLRDTQRGFLPGEEGNIESRISALLSE